MERPELTFPPAEAERVIQAYGAAVTILEYGTGGSTVLCAELPGKTLFAVENDPAWLAGVRDYIAGRSPASTVIFHLAEIGPTKKWGYPIDHSKSDQWSAYPVGVWKRADFMQPDLLLIDGRFRVACFLTCLALTRAPMTVLWDDYAQRGFYHVVEEIIPPVERCGRMAVFQVTPGLLDMGRLLDYVGYFHDPR